MAHTSKKTRHKQLFCGFCARIGLMKKNKTEDTSEQEEKFSEAESDDLILLPGDDVVPQKTVKEIRQLLREKKDDETLVQVYCRVDNFAITFEPPSLGPYALPDDPFVIPRKEHRQWCYLEEDIFHRINIRVAKSNISDYKIFIKKFGYHISPPELGSLLWFYDPDKSIEEQK